MSHKPHPAGFSLIELLIVMVVISVGLLGLASLFMTSTTSLGTNETLQRATQYAQACAERALTVRRSQGFDWFATTGNTFTCDTLPSEFVYSNTSPDPPLVGSLYNGTVGSPCPVGTNNCRDINIKVKSTADAALYSAITVMLVNY